MLLLELLFVIRVRRPAPFRLWCVFSGGNPPEPVAVPPLVEEVGGVQVGDRNARDSFLSRPGG